MFKYLQWELAVQFHRLFHKYQEVSLPVYTNRTTRI